MNLTLFLGLGIVGACLNGVGWLKLMIVGDPVGALLIAVGFPLWLVGYFGSVAILRMEDKANEK